MKQKIRTKKRYRFTPLIMALVMVLTLVIGTIPAMAADDSDISVVWASQGINVTFTAADRAELFTTVGPNSYVETNTAGAFRYTGIPATGITVKDLLEEAGINTNNLEPGRLITFIATDNYTATFTWEQLSEDRYTYTYPSGTGNQDQLKAGVRGEAVPSIISFNQVSASPRNYMGLTYPQEQFRGVMNQSIATIEVGGIAPAWENPYVYVENGTSLSGAPLANGSTVTEGMKLRITNDTHGDVGTSHKYIYTTDGTDPYPSNPSARVFNWNSNGPSVAANPSIVVPDGSGQFVVKAMTYGYGRTPSDIMTFTYNYPFEANSAFLTGPDEVNIDLTDEIEYTVNVANVTDANMFKFIMAYDADKLTYKGMDILLPSNLAAWILDFNNDSVNGEIEFLIAAGARNETLTTATATELVALQFTLKSGVVEDDVIEADLLELSVINPVTGAPLIDATIVGDGVSTLVIVNEVDPLLKYDINNDGVFDLVDLAIIIYRYFMVDETEALWSEASLYNISTGNAVQVIDTADIIALYSLIEAQG